MPYQTQLSKESIRYIDIVGISTVINSGFQKYRKWAQITQL